MAELLLELFSEEIPARMQVPACSLLRSEIEKELQAHRLSFDAIETYVTPRRLVCVVDGLETSIKGDVEEKRGPRQDAPDAAIEGFLRSTGLTKNDLEIRETPKGTFYFAVQKTDSLDVKDVLQDILQKIISGFRWPKSMRWGKHSIRWVRPLHHILCLFDGKVLPVTFGHLTSGQETRGHRFLSPAKFSVDDFSSYRKQLLAQHVLLSTEDRKQKILEDANELVGRYGVHVLEDAGLLEEVAGLVEWPHVMIGKIEGKFMHLPKEVLIASMKGHQKYFSVVDDQGKLAPYFIVVTNGYESKNTRILKGYERVLRARLDDAKFFWDVDRQESLLSRSDALEKIIFHAKLGTMKQKVERLTKLSQLVAVWVPHANLLKVERVAQLSKVDLITEMVGEFPELQGIMGSYYAHENGEDHDVAAALSSHYHPLGPSTPCPDQPLAITVALADKIDSLVGLFIIGEKPTGSKDPFALRRAALGVIRIILENELRIPLKLLIEKALSSYPSSVLKENVADGFNAKTYKIHLLEELTQFIVDRLKVLLKDTKGIAHDYIQAVFVSSKEDDLVSLVKRVSAMHQFLNTAEGEALLAAYRRANNIVVSEAKKDKKPMKGVPDKGLLKANEEKLLYDMFDEVNEETSTLLEKEAFEDLMRQLSLLKDPIDHFFDKVVVNVEDKPLRKNRLLLLSQFKKQIDQVADFSEIS